MDRTEMNEVSEVEYHKFLASQPKRLMQRSGEVFNHSKYILLDDQEIAYEEQDFFGNPLEFRIKEELTTKK